MPGILDPSRSYPASELRFGIVLYIPRKRVYLLEVCGVSEMWHGLEREISDRVVRLLEGAYLIGRVNSANILRGRARVCRLRNKGGGWVVR